MLLLTARAFRAYSDTAPAKSGAGTITPGIQAHSAISDTGVFSCLQSMVGCARPSKDGPAPDPVVITSRSPPPSHHPMLADSSSYQGSVVIAAEDLTAPMSGRKFGKNVNRRLAGWTKGVIAEALASVSRRRSSTLVLVNPAYTSQIDHRNGCLLGKRSGDRFYCFDGVVLPADENAARNVKARLSDPEIDLWTPYQKVKSILLSRTERFRLGLLNQDPSCAPQGPSTGSESPEQLCLSF